MADKILIIALILVSVLSVLIVGAAVYFGRSDDYQNWTGGKR